MNLFYRDFQADAPVTTGAQWLAALTARIAVALVHALPYGRLTSGQVWVLGLLFAAWTATSVFPVTAGLAAVVNAVLIGVGALRLLGRFGTIGGSLVSGLRAAYDARTEAELEAAGALLHQGLDEYALNALSAFVNESTFLAIQQAVLRKFPIPEWFSAVYEKELFYREIDPKQPLTTGGRFFAALAARVAVTLVDALAYTNVKKQLFASAEPLWILGLLLGGWFAVSVIPATAGVANLANTVLVAIGLVALLDRAAEVGRALEAGLRGAYTARNSAELDAAGQSLAPALTGTVVTLIELLMTHQAFRAAEAVSLRRFPMPEWFRSRVEKAGQRISIDTELRFEPTQSRPPEAESPQRVPQETEPHYSQDPAKLDPMGSRPRRQVELDSPQRQPKPQVEAEPNGPRRPAEKNAKSSESKRGKTEQRPIERARRIAAGAAALEGARRTAQAVTGLDLFSVGLAVCAGAAVLGVTAAVLSRSKP